MVKPEHHVYYPAEKPVLNEVIKQQPGVRKSILSRSVSYIAPTIVSGAIVLGGTLVGLKTGETLGGTISKSQKENPTRGYVASGEMAGAIVLGVFGFFGSGALAAYKVMPDRSDDWRSDFARRKQAK